KKRWKSSRACTPKQRRSPMSEPEMEQLPPDNASPQGDQEEEISWADAMEDLERQKQMIRDQAKVPGYPAAPESSASKPSLSPGSELPNLQFILDIPLQVTVELGRKRLLVHDLLQLSQGSVIELTKQIGEPFEVLINQKLIARGEIVVINDKFGVRITDIISPMERVQQLQWGQGKEEAMGRGGVVGACMLCLLIGGVTVSQAAEPAAPTPAAQSMPQPPNGERFLQNVISQSIGQGNSAPV